MCTAAVYHTKDHYFGRNLDLEFSYHETVTITPRNYPFYFRKVHMLSRHYAMIGVAYVVEDYPLYYDAVNEKGLAMAGLNFPDNACYKELQEDMDNVTPFEFIPWVLGQCETVSQVKRLLSNMNLVNICFGAQYPLSPLHWIIADCQEAITVEAVRDGLKIYENPVGILTNNPVFEMQMMNLNNYMNLSAEKPKNLFSEQLNLQTYCCGMGAMGLPGDFSSMSRFVKAAFVKMNSVSSDSEEDSVNQFFHILDSVAFPRGAVRVGEDKYDITVYSSCCNMEKGIYYYTTYENRRINGVDMYREDLNGSRVIQYPLLKADSIMIQNRF